MFFFLLIVICQVINHFFIVICQVINQFFFNCYMSVISYYVVLLVITSYIRL